VDLVNGVDREIASLTVCISRATALRAALLSDLLSGNHEIPAAYDELLRAA
jgi:hypothetical protein